MKKGNRFFPPLWNCLFGEMDGRDILTQLTNLQFRVVSICMFGKESVSLLCVLVKGCSFNSHCLQKNLFPRSSRKALTIPKGQLYYFFTTSQKEELNFSLTAPIWISLLTFRIRNFILKLSQ